MLFWRKVCVRQWQCSKWRVEGHEKSSPWLQEKSSSAKVLSLCFLLVLRRAKARMSQWNFVHEKYSYQYAIRKSRVLMFWCFCLEATETLAKPSSSRVPCKSLINRVLNLTFWIVFYNLVIIKNVNHLKAVIHIRLIFWSEVWWTRNSSVHINESKVVHRIEVT